MQNLIIIEPQALYRDALQSLLSDIRPDMQATGLAQWDDTSLAGVNADLIIVSATTADRNLITVLTGMKMAFGATPVLLLVEHVDLPAATDAFATGVKGMVLKSASASVLAGAIDLLLNGDICFPSSLEAPRKKTPATTASSSLQTISPRQRDVLDLLASGCSNQEIAFRLDIRESTVKNHIQAIFRAFNVASRTQAVIAAANAGLVLTQQPAQLRG